MSSTFNEIVSALITPLLFLITKNQTAIILLIVYVFAIVVLILFNPLNLLTNYSQILFPLIIGIGLLNLFLFLIYKFSNNNYKYLRETATIIFSIIFVFALIIFSLFILINYFIKSTFIIIGIAFLISSLALLKEYFNPSEDDDKQSQSHADDPSVIIIIKELILYIPCLFLNLIEYLKFEFKITTRTIWILLLIEFVLIGIIGLVPFIFKEFSSHDGKTILQGPKYLNNRINIGTFKSIGIGFEDQIKHEKNKKNPIYKYNFAISSWIWINPQPNSTSLAYKETSTLLNYGDVLFIKYKNNKFEIYAKKGDDDDPVRIYKSDNILFQKWNNFILNYYGGTLDIFINDKLVISKINIVPILKNSKVISGQKDGINGGIRNVVYYNNVISRNKIRTIYNLDNF